jgi:large conductance mechanosensitive channel
MLKEFKEFISRGSLVEIAVAFILGLAFAAVVTAFTTVVLDTIAYILGSDVDLSSIGVHNDAGVLVIHIGTFITAFVNFVIIAFVLFLVVKAYNRFQKKEEVAAGPTEIELLTEIRDALRTRSA